MCLFGELHVEMLLCSTVYFILLCLCIGFLSPSFSVACIYVNLIFLNFQEEAWFIAFLTSELPLLLFSCSVKNIFIPFWGILALFQSPCPLLLLNLKENEKILWAPEQNEQWLIREKMLWSDYESNNFCKRKQSKIFTILEEIKYEPKTLCSKNYFQV